MSLMSVSDDLVQELNNEAQAIYAKKRPKNGLVNIDNIVKALKAVAVLHEFQVDDESGGRIYYRTPTGRSVFCTLPTSQTTFWKDGFDTQSAGFSNR